MAVVWTFNVPDAGTRRVSSIEDRIWDGQRTLVSATVGRPLGASRGVPRQIRTRGGGLGDDFKAAPLQRHFWLRNAPYALTRPRNHLITQQMRAPSERTRNPCNAGPAQSREARSELAIRLPVQRNFPQGPQSAIDAMWESVVWL
jgi:hypothetical protein